MATKEKKQYGFTICVMPVISYRDDGPMTQTQVDIMSGAYVTGFAAEDTEAIFRKAAKIIRALATTSPAATVMMDMPANNPALGLVGKIEGWQARGDYGLTGIVSMAKGERAPPNFRKVFDRLPARALMCAYPGAEKNKAQAAE